MEKDIEFDNMSDDLQKLTKSGVVPIKYYEMFALRVLGLTYAQIAEKVGFSEGWVRQLFMNSGVLGQLWKSWVEKAKGDSVEEALTMAFGHLPDAMRSNIFDAKQVGTPVAVASRKMLFDYTLGKPVEKHLVKVNVSTFAEWAEKEALKIQENEQSKSREISTEPD